MSGHGSPRPADAADHSGRKVGRLERAMGWQGILSSGEAEGAMSALRGTGFGGEAVQHYGGAQRLASDAFRNRNTMPPNTWRDYPDRARDPNRIVDPFARARAHGLPYMDDPDLR